MPERVDATGESVRGHLEDAASMLATMLGLEAFAAKNHWPPPTNTEWLEQIAAARQRLDAAERMLKEQPEGETK